MRFFTVFRMTTLLFVLSFFFCLNSLQAQGQDKLFGTEASPSYTTTLTNADASEVGRTIIFNDLLGRKGSVTLWGYALNNSGTHESVTPTIQLLKPDGTLGPNHVLSKITIDSAGTAIYNQSAVKASSDTTWWEVALSAEVFNTYVAGYKPTVTVPASGTHSTEFYMGGMYK